MSVKRLPKKLFDEIYAQVPRVTVEVILKSVQGVLLTKRAIEPCKGQWHLPGGTVLFGEALLDTVKRVALNETGIEVLQAKQVGVIEYPSHYQHGLDQPIGIVFEVTQYNGEVQFNREADAVGWFKNLPTPMHADQDAFLLENHYISSK